MPESWNYDAATVDFDAIWSILGDSMTMANHAKDGDDVFDGGVTTVHSGRLFMMNMRCMSWLSLLILTDKLPVTDGNLLFRAVKKTVMNLILLQQELM